MYFQSTPSRKRAGGGAMPDAPCCDPVEVFCRLKPLPDVGHARCAEADDDEYVKLYPPAEWKPSRQMAVAKTQRCKFTRVFDEFSGQADVFDGVAMDYMHDLIKGKNGLLFTYGITGSGKTHTMAGGADDPGLLPRCLDVIFNSVSPYLAESGTFQPDGGNGFSVCDETQAALNRRRMHNLLQLHVPNTPSSAKPNRRQPFTDQNQNGDFVGEDYIDGDSDECGLGRRRKAETLRVRTVDEDHAYAVFVSYVEIYNQYIYDLLDAECLNNATGGLQSKQLRESPSGAMYVSGSVEIECRSADEAIELFERGQQLRRVAQTKLNVDSSRSHSVFTVRVVQAPLGQDGKQVLCDQSRVHCAQLCLVDLAGSERSSRTGNAGERIKETGHINKSLMCLRRCIEALRDNQNLARGQQAKMVAYRESRLTHLFKNYFDGQGRVRMIVTMNPSADDYEENFAVMEFAELTQEVEVLRANEMCISDDLPKGRARDAKFLEEMEAELTRLANENGHSKPGLPTKESLLTGASLAASMKLFDRMPDCQIRGPSDSDTLPSLVTFFEQRRRRKAEYVDRILEIESDLETSMRQCSFEAGAYHKRYLQVFEEREQWQKDAEQAESKNKTLNRKILGLQRRLATYESDEQRRWDDEQRHRRKEAELRHVAQKTQEKLFAVRNVITPSVSRQRQPQVAAAAANVAPLHKGLGGSTDHLASGHVRNLAANFKQNQGSCTPSTGTNSGSIYPSAPRSSHHRTQSQRNVHTAAAGKRRAPSPPGKGGGKGPPMAYNPKHRRSRSVGSQRVLSHLPQNMVPAGHYLTPHLGRHTKTTAPPTGKQLLNGGEYVLTHQDADSQSGALRTSLVKGSVYPTSGGGAAVQFEDVETVTHWSPGRKRRSDDEESTPAASNSHSKRNKRNVK